MPDLDQLLGAPSTPPAFGGAQCFEATVAKLTDRGLFVTISAFDARKLWGPVMPEGVIGRLDDRVVVAMSNRGRPWLLGAGGGGGAGNVDGGHPDSRFGGIPIVDGGGI